MSRTVAIGTSAPRAGLISRPSYTIQEDPPWVAPSRKNINNRRSSAVPTFSSTYSDDFDATSTHSGRVSPLSAQSNDYYQVSCYADSKQEITDKGPQSKRLSKMPIFKQVRDMLKPASNTRWDEYSGEPSDSGKPAQVKPSTYTSPYEGAFQARRISPERTAARSNKALSSVSIFQDEDSHSTPSLNESRGARSPAPALSPAARPTQVNPNTAPHFTARLPPKQQVKRKPVTASPSASENLPPSTRRLSNSSEDSDDTTTGPAPTSDSDPRSHFSWTTVAPSEVPDIRGSVDIMNNRWTKSTVASNNNHLQEPQSSGSDSRFSWSTMATSTTNVTARGYDDSPPASPPPVPTQYLQTPPVYGPPPTQSILSRRRPIDRLDKEAFAPPPRSASTSSKGSRIRAPAEYTCRIAPVATTSSGKALPLPPLTSQKSFTHLETLLTQEKNLTLQRRNTERSIRDLENVEKASPLEVSFATVRDAKKRLEERRGVLDEVKREEMELGIKIARARRKEDFGDGEGTLWVRRVTG